MTSTASQITAINPSYSIKVSANAGTGKTFVLTQRVLRLMIDEVHPSKILCLTYTKAAAAEMVDRITKNLEKWVTCKEDDLKKELFALLQTNPTEQQLAFARKLFTLTLESTPPPRIQTIHSFCQEVLTRFPLEAGITPNSEILDSASEKELIFEAKIRLLQNQSHEPEVTEAINYFANNITEAKFSAIISEVVSQRNRFKDSAQPIKPDANIEDEINIFLNAKRSDAVIAELITRYRKFPSANNLKRLEPLLKGLKNNDIESYLSCFLKDDGSAYSIKYMATKDVAAGFEDAIIQLQTEAAGLRERINDITTRKFTYYAYFVAQKFLEIYDNLKAANGYLDYNDLLYLTKKLLTTANNSSWVLYKLDGGIDHIMIDEAQDTSPEQWQIISALTDDFFSGNTARSQKRSVFIVGDEKQSIYSFQGAEPKAFAEFTNNIRQKCIASGNQWHDVDLNISYRSTASVLNAVDNVFEPHINAINNNKNQIKHHVFRNNQAGKVELLPIIKRGEKPEHENWHFPTQYYPNLDEEIILAEKIATTISDWIINKRILESQARPINAGDILIIMRSRGDLADLIIKKLKAKNIPVSGADRLKLAEHIAVQDLIALGKYLLLPKDDLNLACLLKSPLFGVTEDELFTYCYNRKSDLWSNLPQDLQAQLDELFNKADILSVYELYSYVLDKLAGRKKFISRLGQEVNEVLDEFLQATLDFEDIHAGSLQKFIHWFLFSSSEIKRDMEQASGQVRVMTVHGSKGLEAPIVFIADSGSKPEGKGKEFFWYENNFLVAENSASANNLYKSLKELNKQEEYNEYLRLLYVAMTRAADELYIYATQGDKKIPDDCWHNIILPVMEREGTKLDDGSFIIHNPQTQIIENKTAITKNNHTEDLPEFIFNSLPQLKEVKKEKVFVDESAAQRGRKIHKLFEHGKLQTKNAVAAEIINNGRAEVPLIANINGLAINKRIDVLWVKENEIIILDYKTAANPPAQIPQPIIEQMNSYEAALALIYPNKTARKFILWTETDRLDEVCHLTS